MALQSLAKISKPTKFSFAHSSFRLSEKAKHHMINLAIGFVLGLVLANLNTEIRKLILGTVGLAMFGSILVEIAISI